LNALCFCVDGTLLAPILAVIPAKNEDKVSSMPLLTTMLDFTDTGEIGSKPRRSDPSAFRFFVALKEN